jgi:phage gpG-like protein
MFSIQLDGLDDTSARLDGYPFALRAALDAKASELAAALAEKVRSEKLAGAVLNARSGALQASIHANVSVDADGVLASVGSEGDVKYAAIQEYGGKTGAHDILPTKAEALAFVIGGALRFARKVEHPGSLIPARSYLRASLEDMSDEIVTELADAADQAWERA